MTLDQYQLEWEQDARISPDALDDDARNVPLLHAKWWRYYSGERLRFRKLDMQFKTLKLLRWEYFTGKLDDDERIKRGWPVQPLKILSQQVDMYLAADPVLQDAERLRILSEETLKFLEDVIKSINNRGFAIKNAIDYLRFKSGN